ncbi:metal-dependent hydrolase [Gracilimonas sediminicola]|uniref:Metal-dependent hydrolase n=1 Tax=Gracilimonas sediminicola TaxID=2952158 RepID=A0A9X2RG22_9BACT|nr:metal-dependent hydrolase [Gracilimonas sediminicola]MCP9293006.1 metal-dependent hydrolase [Gracilimonas sediminicola]
MDPVTHGLIGATASQSYADKRSFRAAAFTGVASAMLADLDVFLGSASDPLLNLELHRQFTHSIVFIPVGALIATLLLWWFVKKYLTVKETYLFSLAGYTTAGITDVFTSYGVLLFWPFTDTRVSLDIISVFDPLFTFGVILFTGMAFYKRKQLFAWLSLGWIAFYLLFGFTQQRKAAEVARKIAEDASHEIHQLIVKPTIANNWLWSIRYTANDSLHAAGVKLIPFSDPVIYNGESTPVLDWESAFETYEGTTLYYDIERFSELSDGILIRHPSHEQVIGDGRYSMLPITLSPLWGIEVDTTKPNQHVQFGTYRDTGEEVRESFLEMLF